jgi:uncharacterized membrane protein YjdF
MTTTTEIEESPGVISMMRVALKESIKLAKWMLVLAALVCVGMFIRDRYELLPVAVALAAGAPGVVGVGSVAKAWQSQAEARVAPVASDKPSTGERI